jgi:acetylglutamate kinase
MKLVVKIGSTAVATDSVARACSTAIARLLKEGHHVTLVHGGSASLRPFTEQVHLNGHGASPGEIPVMVVAGKINKRLVSLLVENGVQAFGLCGADGNIVRLRWRGIGSDSSPVFEAGAVNPFWLDTISSNQAVPVLASLALGPDRNYCMVQSDQLAAACAIGWNADALILLSQDEGLISPDGSVVRWVEAGQIGLLRPDSTVSGNMLLKLATCQHALRHGVRRARILPLAHITHLADFYQTRIDFGTEVFLGA